MKKIINKIKQNENLCKVLKVLKLVLDFVVYGFAIFMIIGLAIGQSYAHNDSKAQDRQLIPNVATTPIKQAYHSNKGYSVYYWNDDIGNSNFFIGLFEEYNKFTGNDYYQFYDQYAYSSVGDKDDFYFTKNTHPNPLGYYFSWSDYDNNTMASYNNGSYAITGISLQVQSISNHSTNKGTIMREVNCNFIIHLGNAPDVTITNGVQFNYYFNSSGSAISCYCQVLQIDDLFILVNDTIDNELMSNIVYNSVSNKITYDKGHEAGYQEGVDAAQQQQNGVFGLLKQAFQSVASVLNIQLIPGLNLGILIFAPLIVTIIVVIIKMFRG